MLVKSLSYSQHDGTPQEWRLKECALGIVNLVVGENASGKTKLLNLIGNLGDLLSGDRGLFLSAHYNVTFDNAGQTLNYVLMCDHAKIREERLDVGSETLLLRGANGVGQIYYEQLHKKVDFQAPPDQVVSISRRDAIQHSFLDGLYGWGRSVRRYYFGSDLGRQNLVVPIRTQKGAEHPELNPKKTDMVVAMVIEGQKRFRDQFNQSVMEDMKAINYDLRDIGTAPPRSIVLEGVPGEVVGIYVRESDLKGVTEQSEMSQGMFRALSLIVQLTYSQLTSPPSCVLIDDIGEGLDYNRSVALVELLIDKAKRAGIQLVMATNDRFVMNTVPLDYWSVMSRIGNVSRVLNSRTSPDLFADFQVTGLNNFDFFSSKYYLRDTRQN